MENESIDTALNAASAQISVMLDEIEAKLPAEANNPNGLYRKYTITKTDGSQCDPKAKYFVLRLDRNGKDDGHIEACRAAACAYIHNAPEHMRQAASELAEWAELDVQITEPYVVCESKFDIALCLEELTDMLRTNGLLMASLVSNTARLEIIELKKALADKQ
jgi:effector-binding domain-containing protein